jgi:hypothetical protein
MSDCKNLTPISPPSRRRRMIWFWKNHLYSYTLKKLLRRWCTPPVRGEMTPDPKLLCDDRLATDGIRASSHQHPV